MATPPAPYINGYRYDWSSLETSILDTRYPNSFSKITYKKARERGQLRGKGPKKVARTRGKETCTASFEMMKEDFEDLKAKLVANVQSDKDTWQDVPFDIICSYEENGLIITDTIVGCLIDSVENAPSRDSQDAAMVSVDLDVMDISLNGDL